MIHRYMIEATDEVKGFEEAIERLDREWGIEELEPCADFISRQAVLDRIRESIETYHNQYTTDMLNMWGLFTQFIKEMPPVNPQPKTGHWEWMPSDDNPKLGDWHCSECRCVVVECVYKNEKRGIPLYKYCPQCGIKMVEPQERSGEE